VALIFEDLYHVKSNDLTGMLGYLKLNLIGKHHSGIDDCVNIARIAIELLQDGMDVNNPKFVRSK